VVLGSVKSILENALELDPGRYVRSGTHARSAWLLLCMQVLITARVGSPRRPVLPTGTSEVLLYAMRLAMRVESFARFVLSPDAGDDL